MSLARRWRDEGRVAETRALVRGVHAGFTEAFDTPDLVDAAALIQALSEAETPRGSKFGERRGAQALRARLPSVPRAADEVDAEAPIGFAEGFPHALSPV